MERYWHVFLTCAEIKDPRPHFLWWTLEQYVFELTGSRTLHLLQVSRESSIKKAFSGMCVLTSITFSVIWPSVFIFESGATVGWFKIFSRIYNIELSVRLSGAPNILQVMMKSRRRGQRASHLGRVTLWHKGRRAKQPGFTIIVVCTRGRTHFPRNMLKNMKA